MRILVSGSSGLVGTALVRALQRESHVAVRLMRPQSTSNKPRTTEEQVAEWDPVNGKLDAARADNSDVLIHLAGTSIAEGRWTAARKAALRTSRMEATRQLMLAMTQLRKPPRVVVAASAIGYYGDRCNEILSEDSPCATGFLAELCRDWEAESSRASEFGARVVMLRFGIILAAHGGALPRMAMPFKFGAGGRLGSGLQWMSWLTLAEVVNIIKFAMSTTALQGPVNTVSPAPLQNKDFTEVLAKALHRPALFPAPAPILRLALGEMADALLLASQRVVPEKLSQAGYSFLQPELTGALNQLFKV